MTYRNTETKNNHRGEREFINDLNRVDFNFFFLNLKESLYIVQNVLRSLVISGLPFERISGERSLSVLDSSFPMLMSVHEAAVG